MASVIDKTGKGVDVDAAAAVLGNAAAPPRKVYKSIAEVRAANRAGDLSDDEADEITDMLLEDVKRAAAVEGMRKAAAGCTVSRDEFTRQATALEVLIGDSGYQAEPKQFSTGSFGWFANGKATIAVGGKPVKCQVNLTITAIGSKEAK